LVENEASLLAGLMFMKRGVALFPIAFKKDGSQDISILQKYSPQELNLIIVNDFKELEEFTQDIHIDVLVSWQNFESLKDYDTKLLVLRPLIAFDNTSIKNLLINYGHT